MLKIKIYRPIMYTDTYTAHSHTQLPQALCAGGVSYTEQTVSLYKCLYATTIPHPVSWRVWLFFF